MYVERLRKPDGRSLSLYATRPITRVGDPPAPPGAEITGTHLRWHPLRAEWIAYAGHRQHRTFLPPAEYNPLAVTVDPAHPTEVPAGDYDIAVFENLFPTLSLSADTPAETIVPVRPGLGVCEVVVFTQDPRATLGTLPLPHLELLLQVWADRYVALGAHEAVQYVMPFENRGVEVGVTLHHPHGQIYAYPFVPPIPARELTAARSHYDREGRTLLGDLLERERADRRRLVYDSELAVALVPVCARYAYEVWVLPVRSAASLAELTDAERSELARALKTVLLKFDALWSKPFPYVMVLQQAPTDGDTHPEWHMRFEFYPAYRMPGRLKYLAGSELGAGVFTADTLPEEKAAELRAVEVSLA